MSTKNAMNSSTKSPATKATSSNQKGLLLGFIYAKETLTIEAFTALLATLSK